MYLVIITEFSERPDGSWLTTGKREVLRNIDRAGVEKLVAERAGQGIKITADSDEGEAWTDLHGTELHFADDAVLVERDHATIH